MTSCRGYNSKEKKMKARRLLAVPILTLMASAAYAGLVQPAPVDVSDYMLRKLSEGDLYVWDDIGTKAILSLAGRAGKGIRISGVYTPPEFRGSGYASAAVAALSHAKLSNGRDFVVLNVTDGNPAEDLYRRLGYRLIGSSDCFLLHN